jgi:hypothetical protein
MAVAHQISRPMRLLTMRPSVKVLSSTPRPSPRVRMLMVNLLTRRSSICEASTLRTVMPMSASEDQSEMVCRITFSPVESFSALRMRERIATLEAALRAARAEVPRA